MATPRKRPEDKQKPGPEPKHKQDPKLIDRICDNLELGMPLDLAAECEGVGRSTIRGWIAEEPEIDGRITRARAAGAKNLVVRALKGGAGSSSANWHLERRYREHYGPPKADVEQPEIKITIEGGLPKRER
jgi:hypothetical protein